MDDGEVTNSELARRLDRIDLRLEHIEGEFADQFTNHRHRMNNIEQRLVSHGEQIKNNRVVVDEVKDSLKTGRNLLYGLAISVLTEAVFLYWVSGLRPH